MKLGKRIIGVLLTTLVLLGGALIPGSISIKAASYADATENSTGGFVTRMYEVVLGREPDQSGYTDWTNRLTSGEAEASDLVYGFFFSNEYVGKNKSNGEIVTDFYKTMLNREPDEGGYANWVHDLDIGMTKQAINAGFVNSAEFAQVCSFYGIKTGNVTVTEPIDLNGDRTDFIYRLYQNCLERKPDRSGYNNWCQYLAEGNSGAQCAYGFFFSDEFMSKGYSNEEYVDILYTTILGRESDNAGKTGWVNELEGGASREHILNGFLFSPEFSKQCEKAGINVGEAIAEPASGTTADSTTAESASTEPASTSDSEKTGGSEMTTAQQNAIKSARQYLGYMAFSRQALIDQLSSEYEGYEITDAEYAVSYLENNNEVNWKEQAVKAAESYLDTMAFSRQGLIDQLASEYGSQFTQEEAEYAVLYLEGNNKVDWKEQAVRAAKSYLEDMSFSRQGLINQLTSEYGDKFTQEEAEYAVDTLGY